MKRLVSFLICVLALRPFPVPAADQGPASLTARVRHDALVLLADRVHEANANPSRIVVSDVVVAQNQAFLSWRSSNSRGVMALIFQDGHWFDAYDGFGIDAPTWWFVAAIAPLHEITPSSEASTLKVDDLRAEGLNPSLIGLAKTYNADVRAANSEKPARPLRGRYFAPAPHLDLWCFGVCGNLQPKGSTVFTIPEVSAGYAIRFEFAPNNATAGLRLEFDARRTQMPSARGVIFEFRTTPDTDQTVTFSSGTKLGLWFPFVLDSTKRYTLSFTINGKSAPDLPGTLDARNVLHFTMPAFSISAHAPLDANIDVK